MAAGANRGTRTSAAYLVEGAVVIDQIENKDDKPTMIELERHGVAQQYAADWFATGVKLGLTDFPNVLENIEEDCLDNGCVSFREVLYKWLKLFPDATWRSLEVALTNVKREKLHLDPVTDVNISMLTSWGRNQIDSIKILLQEAWSNIQYLQKKEEACDETDSKDWLKFRSIMFDLYSVLDYTYYLLYCHFVGKGEPDHVNEGWKCSIPFKSGGVKTSNSTSQDGKRKFLKEQLNILFTGNSKKEKIGEKTHFWKLIGDTILKIQPTQPVNDDGSPNGGIDISTVDQESFAILHHFRNCCTHRNIIQFSSGEVFAEINTETETVRFLNGRPRDKPGYITRSASKGYWIALPKRVIRKTSGEYIGHKLVPVVLKQIFDFVVKTKDELLYYALLIPKPDHIQQPQILFPFPQVQIKLQYNDYMNLKDTFVQQMRAKGLQVDDNYENHTYKLKVKQTRDDDNYLLHLSSELEREEAVKVVMKECIHLGIIKCS